MIKLFVPVPFIVNWTLLIFWYLMIQWVIQVLKEHRRSHWKVMENYETQPRAPRTFPIRIKLTNAFWQVYGVILVLNPGERSAFFLLLALHQSSGLWYHSISEVAKLLVFFKTKLKLHLFLFSIFITASYYQDFLLLLSFIQEVPKLLVL